MTQYSVCEPLICELSSDITVCSSTVNIIIQGFLGILNQILQNYYGALQNIVSWSGTNDM